MTHFLESSDDVAAFAKNQGPQALRIDCLSHEGIRSLYTPDFVVRRGNGHYFLVETKGIGFAKDPAVATKAKAAQGWCKAASSAATRWEYLYVPQQVFNSFTGDGITGLASACRPALVRLVKDAVSPQLTLGLDALDAKTEIEAFISAQAFDALSGPDRNAVVQAIQLFDFMAGKPDALLAPVFQPLLGRVDHAAENLILARLESWVPVEVSAKDEFFIVEGKANKFLVERSRSLKRLLVTRSPIMPTGLLLFCLEYASKDAPAPDGLLNAVRTAFSELATTGIADVVQAQYDFRNEYIAHEKREPLRSAEAAREALGVWIDALLRLREAVG